MLDLEMDIFLDVIHILCEGIEAEYVPYITTR